MADAASIIQKVRPTGLPVEPSSIEKALEIYLPEHRYVVRANFSPLAVTATVRLVSYSVTFPGILEYVTASQLMTLISQVGYLLIHQAIAANLAPINMEDYLVSQRAGDVIFTHVDGLRFRRKVMHSEGEVNLLVSCQRFAVHGRMVVSHVTFDFADSAARGAGTVVILLPS